MKNNKQENCCTPIGQIKRYVDCKGCDRKSKQETTLEEAAESKWSLEKAQEFAINKFKSEHKKGIVTLELILEVLKVGVLTGHKFGAKWQQERSYSEEDMIEFAKWMYLEVGTNSGKDRTNKELFNLWVIQNKKK